MEKDKPPKEIVKLVRTLTYYGPKEWIESTMKYAIKDRRDFWSNRVIIESRTEIINPTISELYNVFEQGQTNKGNE